MAKRPVSKTIPTTDKAVKRSTNKKDGSKEKKQTEQTAPKTSKRLKGKSEDIVNESSKPTKRRSTSINIECTKKDPRKSEKRRSIENEPKRPPRRKRSTSEDNGQSAKDTAHKTRVKRKSGEGENTEYKVPTKQYLKWQPVSTSTMATIHLILDANAREVLNLCSTRSHRDIQKHLDTIKHRVVRKVEKLKAPSTREEYSRLENNMSVLEESLHEAASQIQLLQTEMDRTERFIEADEETERELKRKLVLAEAKLSQQEGAGLEDGCNLLNLPALPSQRGRGQKSGGVNSSDEGLIARLQGSMI